MKVDNPAQLEKVSSCIERCQKLQKLGPHVCSMKPREELLRDILDDLKWLSQISGRSTLSRSQTTVEDKWNRSKKKSRVKQRRSSMVLANIKEEREQVSSLSFSTTLPRDVAINVNGESRKVGVLMRSASVNATSHTASSVSPPLPQPRKGIAAKPGLPTITSSPRRAKKRSPILRRPPRTLPPDDDESPMLHWKSRLPKLAKMTEKPESMEYAADDEEISDLESGFPGSLVDSPGSPSQRRRLKVSMARTPEEPSVLVISNAAKGSSPFQTKKKAVSFEQGPGQELVSVEVHCNNGAVGPEETPISDSLSSSHDDHQGLGTAELIQASITSETFLLPKGGSPEHSSPHRRRQQGQRVNTLDSAELEMNENSLRGIPEHLPRRRRHQSLEVSRPSVTELGESVTSGTYLLPEGGSPKHSSQRRRRRSKSPSIPPRKKSLSQPNVRGDDRDRLINTGASEGFPYFAWENRPEEGGGGGLMRMAYSLDRKTVALAERSGAASAHKESLYDTSESDQG